MNKSALSNKRADAGEGEAGFLLIIIGAAVAISVGYFTIGWIRDVKDARANYGKKGAVNQDAPPPKSLEDMGGYEVTY